MVIRPTKVAVILVAPCDQQSTKTVDVEMPKHRVARVVQHRVARVMSSRRVKALYRFLKSR